MTRLCQALSLVGLWLLSAAFSNPSGLAAGQAQNPFPPWNAGERLTYRLLWPSGMNLGEAMFRASASGKEVSFQLMVEANLPQSILSDSFSSVAGSEGLCSREFHQKISEGTRRWEESIEFDQAAHQARRTRGGQTTTASIPECARDPLTFLYYFRSQLAAGRPLGSGQVHLGATSDLRIEKAGTETIVAGGRKWPTEKFQVTYTGRNSQKTFALWVSTDSAHVPVRISVPFPLAVFVAELQ